VSAWSRRALAIALAGGVVACSLAIDLDPLDQGCPADTKPCNDTCVPLDSTKTGCGRLNTCAPCALYHAKSGACRSDTNECIVSECQDGFLDCEAEQGTQISDNCRTNIFEDPLHCGRCDRQCPAPPNAEAACGAGDCYFLCNFGWGDCNGIPTDGCEIHLDADPTSCGACGYACVDQSLSPYQNMTGNCVNGACVCAGEFADCNRVGTDGCETNLLTDVNNCGACGVGCTDGQTCTDGSCVTS
jgi:hypothetical protein